MLKSLSVTNFALIEQASVEFSDGFNVLTGETGAGKSILIDALNSVLGGRTSVDFIRTGNDWFRLEAVFDITNVFNVCDFLEQQDIIKEDDGTLIISRKVNRHGKNTVTVNGCHVTLSTLRLLGLMLIDMHGQHENQSLLRPEMYLSLVDNYEPDIGSVLDLYKSMYRKWVESKQKLTNLEQDTRAREQRIDMLSWQVNEIAAAKLKIDEEDQLEQQICLLSNSEKILSSMSRAHSMFSDDGTGQTVLTLLAKIKKELEVAEKYDVKLAAVLSTATDALYQLEDCASQIRDYLDEFEYDPSKLSELQERMDVIYKLKRKYGASIAEIVAYYQDAKTELDQLNNFEEETEKLKSIIAGKEKELLALAQKLSMLREKAAKTMEKEIITHLTELGMPNAEFRILVSETSNYGNRGKNEVSLLFSANPGEVIKPLQKIASGGELSRIALAIKAVSAAKDKVNTMIFDEVDTGIGGQTAQMVADKVAFVATSKQVLVITHLPQMACMADRHIYIQKLTDTKHSKTIIKALNEQERILELTRMIAGDITQVSIDTASEMLQRAKIKKEFWKKEA